MSDRHQRGKYLDTRLGKATKGSHLRANHSTEVFKGEGTWRLWTTDHTDILAHQYLDASVKPDIIA